MKKILIIGSGVVGQATGFGLKGKGNEIIFVDINKEIINRLCSAGENVCLSEEILEKISGIDVVMFCVSTPSEEDGSVNLRYITKAVSDYGSIMKSVMSAGCRHLVVIRSTVLPGTTEEVFIPLLEEKSGLKAGEDFGVCMQPEFLRAKSSEEDFAHPWATVIGESDGFSGEQLEKIYEDFGGEIFHVDLTSAEMIKYIHNLINACKISFANEVWKCLEFAGVHSSDKILSIVAKTAESCWNPEYGMKAGRPYGGTCLPKDTKGFLAWAEKNGLEMSMLNAIIKTNESMEVLSRLGIVPLPQIEGANWKPSPAISLSK